MSQTISIAAGPLTVTLAPDAGGSIAAFTVARKTDLGGKENWDAMVDDQRRELVHWVRNNLADLVDHSIYRSQQRWRPIWRRHDGGRRKKKASDVSYRGSHWLRSYDGHW